VIETADRYVIVDNRDEAEPFVQLELSSPALEAAASDVLP
jgi:hypothetical protein